jgi:hypothetical protein
MSMRRDSRFSKALLLAACALVMVGGLVVVAMLLVGSTYDVQASYVEPEFLPGASNEGKTCSDLQGAGQTWIELKLEGADLSDGSHTEGALTVTISSLTGDSFDWASNIGVDAVLVKGGNQGSNLYRYDPPAESTGDADLGVPNPENNGVSHISFC